MVTEITMAYIKYAVFKLAFNNIPLTFHSLESELEGLMNMYSPDRIIELVNEVTESLVYY